MRRMVATTMGREDNIVKESALAILPVLFFWFSIISLLSPTCWAWRRDNDEVDGGDDDGTRRQHVHRRRKYVGYTTCLLLTFVVISLLSSTCWLWRRDNDEEDGGDEDGTRGLHRQRKYVGYTTCLLCILSFCCLPHAGYGGGTTTMRMVVTTTA